jgi:hypothetical protein
MIKVKKTHDGWIIPDNSPNIIHDAVKMVGHLVILGEEVTLQELIQRIHNNFSIDETRKLATELEKLI